MKKFFAIVAVGLYSLCSLALADDAKLGVGLRVGYYMGSSFKLNSGQDGNVNGIQVGLDFPVSHTRAFELAFSPSIVLGAKTGGTQGQIYKFLLSGKSWINKDLYARVEAGFAHTESRNNTFRDVNDFVTGISLGFVVGKTPGFVARYKPALELGTYISRHRELNGIVVSLGFSF